MPSHARHKSSWDQMRKGLIGLSLNHAMLGHVQPNSSKTYSY